VPNDSPSDPPWSAEASRIYIDIYKENTNFVRHYEDIRFKFSQISVTLTAALVGFAKLVDLHQDRSKSIAVFVILLGLVGAAVTVKYSERADRHAAVARAFRRAASDAMPRSHSPTLETIYQSAAEAHNHGTLSARAFRRVRARWLWLSMHLAIAAIGVELLLAN
jgi:hypothetical protein